MTDQPFDTPEAAEAFGLITQLFEERIETAGATRLQSLMTQDQTVRRLYVRLAHQYCAVTPLLAAFQSVPSETVEADSDEHAPTIPSTQLALAQAAQRKAMLIKLGLISAAAMIALVVGLIGLLKPASTNAVLSAEVDASWSVVVKPGEAFPSKQVILTTGLAKIQMSDGATVIAEAPATFKISKPDEIELIRGSLTATAPQAAHGFAILTSTAHVLDLGTEFGVQVNSDQSTDIVVFRGSVEATGSSGGLPKQTFVAGDSVQVSSHGNAITPITSPRKVFARNQEFDNRAAEVNVAAKDRWRTFSYQVCRDPDLVAYYLFDPDKESSNSLRNIAPTGTALNAALMAANGDLPTFVAGRWASKQALSFHASMQQDMKILPSPLLDFATPAAPARSFSVVIWVKTEGAQPVDGSILTHGEGRLEQYSIGILSDHFRAWTQYPKAKPEQGTAVGLNGPPVSDGWHQLVLTANPAGRQSVFYVDGKSTARQSNIPVMLLSAEHSPTLIGARLNEDGTVAMPSFNGFVDQVAVYSRALSDSEVQNLYDSEKP